MNEPNNVNIYWVLMTPEMASEFLRRNKRNRNLRSRLVSKYAADMKAGSWVSEASDPIRRTDDGLLLDGQHRLNAVVESGKPVFMLVADGINPDAQFVMDTGAARGYSDALRIEGMKNSNIYAAVLRWIVLWERGERGKGGVPPTNQEMSAVLTGHPEVKDSVEFASHARHQFRLPTAVWGMSHWLFTRIDPDDAEWFLSRVADGAELSSDHPAYALRERARRDREANRQVLNHVHLALMIIAWNAYRDRRPLSKLQLPTNGLGAGNYPVPK